jgi:S-adenosylmethionine decarboxylase
MAEHEVILAGEDPQFFEGVEKLLEVWFTRSDGRVDTCDLRKIPR